VWMSLKGVGVMQDEELKFEKIESSHTLVGCRTCRYSEVRYTMVNRSHRILHRICNHKGRLRTKPMDLCEYQSLDGNPANRVTGHPSPVPSYTGYFFLFFWPKMCRIHFFLKKMCPYLSLSLSLYTHFGYFMV
jgi:hypothetical protein